MTNGNMKSSNVQDSQSSRLRDFINTHLKVGDKFTWQSISAMAREFDSTLTVSGISGNLKPFWVSGFLSREKVPQEKKNPFSRAEIYEYTVVSLPVQTKVRKHPGPGRQLDSVNVKTKNIVLPRTDPKAAQQISALVDTFKDLPKKAVVDTRSRHLILIDEIVDRLTELSTMEPTLDNFSTAEILAELVKREANNKK